MVDSNPLLEPPGGPAGNVLRASYLGGADGKRESSLVILSADVVIYQQDDRLAQECFVLPEKERIVGVHGLPFVQVVRHKGNGRPVHCLGGGGSGSVFVVGVGKMQASK